MAIIVLNFFIFLYFSFSYNIIYSSSEVKEVKGVIAPYGRRGVKTIVFLA
ncbi:hypothetical protein PREVCOP_05707 [Segatella copri DSM 18205]|uniref:Uncharacterized protein n=1 Tax=Segatella copri DSM 18205 TaxID=537011 RepID=D1PEQ2_9BACT|nr:hypothetical protein PREVCOP_05707 [Segatella copri DSM 18205]